METEAFLSCFVGHLRELLPAAVYLRVYSRPLESTADRLLMAQMDSVHWSDRIDVPLIEQRPPEWGDSYARGLALLAHDAWERTEVKR